MKTLGLILLFGSLALANQRVQGDCMQGGNTVTTNALVSTTLVMQSFPRCTITVYATGTLNLSTLYSDVNNTPLSNPFTADATGHWYFYAANGRYDVQLSGGGLTAPFTLGDILLQDNASGGTITSVTGTSGVTCNTVSGAVTCSFSGTWSQISGTKQGNTNVPQMAGTNSGVAGAQLCNDASGNATTSGCASGLPTATTPLTYLRIPPNTGNLTSVWSTLPVIWSTDYAFPTQSPSGTLTSGISNTITLSPVPLGVNGTDANHYLYIPTCSGGAQAVLITGGTAVSGAASGTITFTPANSCTAGWTIQSATAGIQEAAIVAGQAGSVKVPAGVYHLKQTVTLPSELSLIGDGSGETELIQDFTSGDAVAQTNSATPFWPNGSVIRGIAFNSSVTVTAGVALHIIYGGNVIDDIAYQNVANGILCDSCVDSHISHIRGSTHTGYGIQLGGTTGATGATITDWQESSTSANTIGLNCYNGNVQLSSFDIQEVGNASRGIILNTPCGESQISNGIIDSAQVAINTAGTGTIFSVLFSNLLLSSGAAPSGSIAINLGASHNTGISFDNVRVSSYSGATNCEIVIANGSDISFNQLTMGNSSVVGTCGIVAGLTTGVSGLRISNSLLGVNQDGTDDADWKASLYLQSGTDGVYVNGGRFTGTTAPIVNNATLTKAVISGVSGVADVVGTITQSTGTVTFPLNPNGTWSSATGVTAVAGLWAGRTGTFVNTNAAPGAWSAGATIGNACTVVQNALYSFFFDGTKIWISGKC